MMEIVLEDKVPKQLKRLGPTASKKILLYLKEIASLEEPRSRGKGLVGNMTGYWRYRVEDYRIICRIFDDELIIEVIKVGHRSTIYK